MLFINLNYIEDKNYNNNNKISNKMGNKIFKIKKLIYINSNYIKSENYNNNYNKNNKLGNKIFFIKKI